MQAAMHCALSLGLWEGKFDATHWAIEFGVGSEEQPAIKSSVASPIAAMHSLRLIRLSHQWGGEFAS
jgi:hypothetical protein